MAKKQEEPLRMSLFNLVCLHGMTDVLSELIQQVGNPNVPLSVTDREQAQALRDAIREHLTREAMKKSLPDLG